MNSEHLKLRFPFDVSDMKRVAGVDKSRHHFIFIVGHTRNASWLKPVDALIWSTEVTKGRSVEV